MPKRNPIERQKNRNNNNLTSKQVKNNIDFLGAILNNATPEDLATWRKKLPTLIKPIKTGLKNKFNITF
tara:strand:- start:59 stop:265 length:207 start_codon:yes stop_codon:yes gene_type:complete